MTLEASIKSSIDSKEYILVLGTGAAGAGADPHGRTRSKHAGSGDQHSLLDCGLRHVLLGNHLPAGGIFPGTVALYQRAHMDWAVLLLCEALGVPLPEPLQ